MRWPWVSRLAYDAVVSERDWLRGELEKTRDHQRRLDRRAEGLAETPPVRRTTVALPPDLARLIAGMPAGPIRDRNEQAIRTALAKGDHPDEVRAAIKRTIGE